MCERELENRVRKQEYVVVSFRIPRDVYVTMLELAHKKLCSVSDIIREAILEYIGEKNERK